MTQICIHYGNQSPGTFQTNRVRECSRWLFIVFRVAPKRDRVRRTGRARRRGYYYYKYNNNIYIYVFVV